MANPIITFLVGILLTIAVIVVLANTVPIPPQACPAVAAATETIPSGASSSLAAAVGSTLAGAPSTSASPPATASAPATAPAPTPIAPNSTIGPGQFIAEGGSLTSPDGTVKLKYQFGKVELLRNNNRTWISSNAPLSGGVFMLKPDGTLGLFQTQYSVQPTWTAVPAGQSVGAPPHQLVLGNDGSLVLFDSVPRVIWAVPDGAPASPAVAVTPTYSISTSWINNINSNPAFASGTLDACKTACSADFTCAGFSRDGSVADTSSSACYKFTQVQWGALGAQQPSMQWRSYVKS